MQRRDWSSLKYDWYTPTLSYTQSGVFNQFCDTSKPDPSLHNFTLTPQIKSELWWPARVFSQCQNVLPNTTKLSTQRYKNMCMRIEKSLVDRLIIIVKHPSIHFFFFFWRASSHYCHHCSSLESLTVKAHRHTYAHKDTHFYFEC